MEPGAQARRPSSNTANVADFKVSDDWIEGKVVSATNFGVFVKVTPPGGSGEAQGLLHISQISEERVEVPADEVEIGQTVKVRVIDVDPQAGRVALSMKEPGSGGGGGPRGPPRAPREKQDVSGFEVSDDWKDGVVTAVEGFGIFVKVGATEGLVHVSEIRDGFVEDPTEEAEEGMDVRVRVINVDNEKGQLGLSMKEPAEAEVDS